MRQSCRKIPVAGLVTSIYKAEHEGASKYSYYSIAIFLAIHFNIIKPSWV